MTVARLSLSRSLIPKPGRGVQAEVLLECPHPSQAVLSFQSGDTRVRKGREETPKESGGGRLGGARLDLSPRTRRQLDTQLPMGSKQQAESKPCGRGPRRPMWQGTQEAHDCPVPETTEWNEMRTPSVLPAPCYIKVGCGGASAEGLFLKRLNPNNPDHFM